MRPCAIGQLLAASVLNDESEFIARADG